MYLEYEPGGPVKKLVFLISILLSFSALADFPTITAKNFSMDYRKNNGIGYVNFLKYNVDRMTFTHTALQAQIKKYPDRIVMNDTENQIEFHSTLDFMDNFSALDLDDLDLLSIKKSFDLNIAHAVVEIDKATYDVNKFIFKCLGQDKPNKGEEIDQAFAHCANKTDFMIEKAVFNDASPLSDFFTNIVVDSATQPENKFKNPLKVNTLHNLDIKINKNVLKALVKIKYILEIPLTADGIVHFDKDKSQFQIEVKKATIASFIDVKKFMFKELAKLKLKELKVEPPYVYITVASKKPVK